jgi:hypothetical protein
MAFKRQLLLIPIFPIPKLMLTATITSSSVVFFNPYIFTQGLHLINCPIILQHFSDEIKAQRG